MMNIKIDLYFMGIFTGFLIALSWVFFFKEIFSWGFVSVMLIVLNLMMIFFIRDEVKNDSI